MDKKQLAEALLDLFREYFTEVDRESVFDYTLKDFARWLSQRQP